MSFWSTAGLGHSWQKKLSLSCLGGIFGQLLMARQEVRHEQQPTHTPELSAIVDKIGSEKTANNKQERIHRTQLGGDTNGEDYYFFPGCELDLILLFCQSSIIDSSFFL